MNSRCPILPGLILVLIASACAPASIIQTIRHDDVQRTPKPGNFPMQILHKEDIKVPYIVVGTLWMKASERRDPALILEAIRAMARDMGADALMDYTIIVPLEEGGIPTGWVRYTVEAVVFETEEP
jgi:hypothetical protein